MENEDIGFCEVFMIEPQQVSVVHFNLGGFNHLHSDLGLPHLLGSISLITIKRAYVVSNTCSCTRFWFSNQVAVLRELRCSDGSIQ